MIPPKLFIAAGVALLIFGSAALVYNITRPQPPLVALPAEALPPTEVEQKPETQTPEPDPSPSPDTASVSTTSTKPSRAQHSVSPPPRSLAITLVSPTMGQTFTAPANVTLKAVVRPFGHELQKVEFYSAPVGKWGGSVCRSLSKGNETDRLTKIGEALSAPHEMVWSNLDEGIYNLMAVATYEEGEQQFSQPIVIIVNKADNYMGDEWRGWRPPYPPEQSPAQDASLLPAPTPTPALESCPIITVTSTSESTRPGRFVTFHAAVTTREPAPDVTYAWKVSEGKIVGDQNTATITVDTAGVLEKSLSASVDVGRLYAVCSNTAFHSVPIVQPGWMSARVKSSLQGTRLNLYFQIAEAKLEENRAARLFIILTSEKEGCISEEIIEKVRLTQRYLTDIRAIDGHRIVLAESTIESDDVMPVSNVDFTVSEEPPAGARILPGNKLPFVACKEPLSISKGENTRRSLSQEKEKLQNLAFLGQQEPTAQLYILIHPPENGCVTEQVAERVKASREYLVRLGIERSRIVLAISEDTNDQDAGSGPIYRLVPEGTEPPATSRIANGDELPFAVCDSLGEPPLNRKCPDIAEFVGYGTITTTKIHEVNTCPYNPSEPQNSETQLLLFNELIGGVYSSFPSFKYWVNGGKVIGEGENAVWDLSEVKLRPGIYTAIVQADDGCDCTSVTTTQVYVTNFCTPCFTLECASSDSPSDTQNFAANVRGFVHAGTPTYHWRTSKGRIIGGQGTPVVSIDVTDLPDGTEYLVTVAIGGIQSYCLNQLSYHAVVGRPCPPQPFPRKVDAYEKFDDSRAAKRRKPKNEEVSSETEGTEDEKGLEPGEGGPPDKPAVKEKEWIEVKWSPRVEIQRSFSIVVTYNRTTESVEVSDKAGNLVEALNFSGAFKLLKERYGPDYEVYANVRLRSSGIECSTCNEEQYQSLDSQRAEWSWNVLPNKSGIQTFNLELWVKGVPRVEGKAAKGPEKLWSKNDLKVEVYEPTFTRNTIFATSLFLGIAGVGFSIKGIKIYRVGDTYNVGQAVAVGRNVTMQNTTVNQTKENTTVDQNTEEKK